MGEESSQNGGSETGSTLPQRILGRTGLRVSALGFGGANIGDLYFRVDEETAVATATTAIESGVTLLDTSPFYGSGLSEHRIGSALRRAGREGVSLSTKVGRYADPFRPCPGSTFAGGLNHAMRIDYSYDGAMRSIEQSLLRLGSDHIEIALVHDLDLFSHGERLEGYYRDAMKGAVEALTRLREEKVIRGFGVGVNEAEMAERFVRDTDADVVLLAGQYSLLDQPALPSFLPLAEERGIGVILGGVFQSGILATGAIEGAKYNYAPATAEVLDRVRKLEQVCDRNGTRLRHAALRFVFGHPAVSCVVLGAESSDQVRTQISDLQTPVPADLWEDLRRESLLDETVPTPS